MRKWLFSVLVLSLLTSALHAGAVSLRGIDLSHANDLTQVNDLMRQNRNNAVGFNIPYTEQALHRISNVNMTDLIGKGYLRVDAIPIALKGITLPERMVNISITPEGLEAFTVKKDPLLTNFIDKIDYTTSNKVFENIIRYSDKGIAESIKLENIDIYNKATNYKRYEDFVLKQNPGLSSDVSSSIDWVWKYYPIDYPIVTGVSGAAGSGIPPNVMTPILTTTPTTGNNSGGQAGNGGGSTLPPVTTSQPTSTPAIPSSAGTGYTSIHTRVMGSDDCMLVPARFFKKVGATVVWDARAHQITIARNDASVRGYIGKRRMTVHRFGTTSVVAWPVAPREYHHVVWVPLRATCKALALSVDTFNSKVCIGENYLLIPLR